MKKIVVTLTVNVSDDVVDDVNTVGRIEMFNELMEESFDNNDQVFVVTDVEYCEIQ